MSGIAETARIAAKASLGTNVVVGDFTIIREGVVLEDDCVVESFCELGHPASNGRPEELRIGRGSLIRSHSVFYGGSSFGPGLRTGHRVTVREGTRAGKDLQIGTLSDLQGDQSIGDHVRLHSSVHVGQKTQIGNFVWIFPYSVFTNDPHPPSEGFLTGVRVDDYAVIGTMCCLLPGVHVGTRALVAAHSLVARDVPADTVVAGSPARAMGPTSVIRLRDGSGRSAYPWMRHFHRGYPAEVLTAWQMEYGDASGR